MSNEYDSTKQALEGSGYTCVSVSPRGALLFESVAGQRIRLATYAANEATSRWLSEQGGSDITVDSGGCVSPDMDGKVEFVVSQSESVVDYHSDYSHISKSMLNEYCDSPMNYYLTFVTGEKPRKKPTKGMEIGTICHAVLLEKKRIEDLVAVYPQSCFSAGGRLSPEKAKEFSKRVGKRIAVKEQTVEQCESVIRATMRSDLSDALSCGESFEKRFNGEISGLKAKCKPDFCSAAHRICYDLKFGQVRPDDFWRVAKRFRYYLQSEMYSLILEQNYPGDSQFQFRFFAVETVFPFRIQPYWYDDRSREIARDYAKQKMSELKVSIDTGCWSDNWSSEGVIGPWDVGSEYTSMEISEVDDDEDTDDPECPY